METTEKREVRYLFGPHIKEVVNKANRFGLTKEDIICITPVKDTVYLVYYN